MRCLPSYTFLLLSSLEFYKLIILFLCFCSESFRCTCKKTIFIVVCFVHMAMSFSLMVFRYFGFFMSIFMSIFQGWKNRSFYVEIFLITIISRFSSFSKFYSTDDSFQCRSVSEQLFISKLTVFWSIELSLGLHSGLLWHLNQYNNRSTFYSTLLIILLTKYSSKNLLIEININNKKLFIFAVSNSEQFYQQKSYFN